MCTITYQHRSFPSAFSTASPGAENTMRSQEKTICKRTPPTWARSPASPTRAPPHPKRAPQCSSPCPQSRVHHYHLASYGASSHVATDAPPKVATHNLSAGSKGGCRSHPCGPRRGVARQDLCWNSSCNSCTPGVSRCGTALGGRRLLRSEIGSPATAVIARSLLPSPEMKYKGMHLV